MNDATHYLVCNEDGTEIIENKVEFKLRNWKSNQVEVQVGFRSRKLDYIYHSQKEKRQQEEGKIQDEENLVKNKQIDDSIPYFKAVEYPICEIPLLKMSEKHYLSESQVSEFRREYGSCEKKIEIPSIFEFLIQEMTSPFYFLQYASVVVWFMQNYIQFAIIIISVQFSITIFNYIMTRVSLLKIKKMALLDHKVRVFREGSTEQGQLIDSKYLVTGDIIELEEKMTIPCDCLLIQGELLMNEVSLTGESIPIPKVSIASSETLPFNYDSVDHKKHYLFDGTVIFQTKSSQSSKVLAKVVRVGFTSFKGQILRSILYPRPTEFDFVKNSLLFFIGLAVLQFTIYLARVPKMYEIEISVITYFYRLFDTLTWTLPPFLPIFQSLSLSFALMRLRVHNIFGIEPQKTMIAGKITHMCFDKTGTLTTNGIEVNGYFDENLGKMVTLEDLKQQSLESISKNIHFKLFATCHGAYLMNGQLVGDMLDIEMMKYSQFKLENSSDISIKFKAEFQDTRLEVLQMFEFDSSLQRMSTIVRDAGKKYAFLKGAPEMVRELCIPTTIPSNFTEKLNVLSLKGFRILGLSYRELSESENPSAMQRQDLEKNLNFLGFLVLENKLKPDTAECIQRLKEGGVECKIISGDNPLTTLQTGSECNILDENNKVYFIDAAPSSNALRSKLVIQKVESEHIQMVNNSDDQERSFEILDQLIANNEQIVITGKVLDYFENTFQMMTGSETEIELCHYSHLFSNNNRKTNKINTETETLKSFNKTLEEKLILYCNLIVNTSIFARMRPEQKRRIIEILQSQHLRVGMIGDGANDCEAIKQGDIGISFATADAALTAPFSSNDDSIKCVETILLDGRATLTNNIEIFRVIILQNTLKFMGCVVMMEEAQNFGDFQFTYLSFFCGMPLMALLAISRPNKKLSPHIPDDKFYKLPNQISIYSQILIYSISLIIGCIVLKAQPWHTPTYTLEEFQGVYIFRKEGALNSIVFLMINLFYMSSGFSYFISNPFKFKIYRNYLLSIYLLAYTIYGIIVIARPEHQIPDFLIYQQLFDKHSFMGYILLITLIACSSAIIIEDFIIKKYIGFKEFSISNYIHYTKLKTAVKQ
ncbi:hypothetical protein ABPG74_000751 [Tetrahymena malaccensis]